MLMLRASVSTDDEGKRGAILEEFVAAAVGDDPARADSARSTMVERLDSDWLVDASAVIANFEMMTRLADATGARLRREQMDAAAPVREELGLDAFPSMR